MDPINFRMRTSCSIDESLLVDFSADTYARCLYGKLDLTRVEHIVFTHSHSDHLYPPDLIKIIPPFGLHDRTEPLHLYGNERVGKALEDNGIASPKAAAYLRFHPLEAFQSYDIGGYAVTPLPANHDPHQVCLLYVIQRAGKTLLYGHDTGLPSEETWEGLARFRFDGVILDCTTGGTACPYFTHMGVPENRVVRQRMLDQGMAGTDTAFFLTHFAHSCGPYVDSMAKLAAENGFIAAYDGFVAEI
ncbi:MAG TPA: MBL fold metallo-hydrolase [Clostridia bacterium]|nr:MBL fold metallo-hydrolase [Clostridia bacterium]